ncbi:hypothetical protein [Flavobacterium ustbae]|uniref:hypothetical protein n=1 Tax=Flavobacterium ustbae TaxID=2488790 RepID=UPI000F791970|nr:hypothetical protein [Flavobacterium ustbae]
MKKILIAGLLLIIAFYALKQFVYNPYKWKKDMNNPEHKLQLGSFIFSKQRGSNGSQSTQRYYFIFKVTEINGDYLRLSVIRQLSQKEKLKSSDFSTSKEDYADLKNTIKSITITPILTEDLYKEDPSFTLNDYLETKYPSLKQSRYYYEYTKLPLDSPQYYNMIYSKDEIIKNGKLVRWILNHSTKPELAKRLSQNIDLILN